jgi:hypothetical protein
MLSLEQRVHSEDLGDEQAGASTSEQHLAKQATSTTTTTTVQAIAGSSNLVVLEG